MAPQNADTSLSAAEILEGSVAHLAAAFKATTASLASNPTMHSIDNGKGIMNLLDSALYMRNRLQQTSPQTEAEMSKMKEEIGNLQVDIASLKATKTYMPTAVPINQMDDGSKVEHARTAPDYYLEVHNAKARNKNALVISTDELLEPLLDQNGNAVAEFPVDGTQLGSLTSLQWSALLNAFGLSNLVNQSNIEEQFCHYIGAYQLACRFKEITSRRDKEP